jgi:hypothetical protein
MKARLRRGATTIGRGIGLAVALTAAPALATPEFPPAIESYLMLSAPPACTVCHATNAGGVGTVTKPFGMAMVAAGLEPYDVPSLDAALATLKKDGASSAGDGVADITKLMEGLDPNVPVNGSFGPEEPAFGCGANVAGAPASDSRGLAIVLAAVTLAWMTRRGRRRAT